MIRILCFVLIMVGLVGCASAPPSPYGNFVPLMSHANDIKIADDVVQKLVGLYPPASTRFDLQHANTDLFGTYLVETMRTKGYAVQEINPEPKASVAADNFSSDFSEVKPESKKADIIAVSSPSTPGFSLSYIVDQAKDSDLYRISLLVNQQSLSRVYQIKDDMIFPASPWIRKE